MHRCREIKLLQCVDLAQHKKLFPFNEESLSFSAYLTIVINKAEIEKQISTRTNSPERYYNKWKPLIDKKFVT